MIKSPKVLHDRIGSHVKELLDILGLSDRSGKDKEEYIEKSKICK